MKPYQWMTTYTHQREWIEGKGFLMPIAFYLGTLGGGLYLVSLLYGSKLGIIASLIIIIFLKGGAHLLDLGKPLTSWRMFTNFRSSWISRGLILVLSFIVFVSGLLLISHMDPSSGVSTFLAILSGITAIGLCVYPGFSLNCVTAIPLWNSAAVPILFVSVGLLGGLGVLLGLGSVTGDIKFDQIQTGTLVVLIITTFILLIFISTITYRGASGRKSLREMVAGRSNKVFWVGIVLLGTVVPLSIGLWNKAGANVHQSLIFLEAFGVIQYGFSLAFVLMRAGVYSPLIPISAVDYK